MENAYFSVWSNGTTLTFDGCTLVDAKYDEKPGEVDFGEDWFISESGERIEIEFPHDEPHPHGDGSENLYAYIKVDGRTLKKLEILEGGMGTFYVEPDEGDD